MKVLVASLVLGLSGGLASAATLNCSGSYWWVRFQARATTSERAIVSPVQIKVSGIPGGPKSWNLTPTASLVSPGQSISFSATAPEGGGSMLVTYNGTDYRGHINAQTQYGNFNVPVACTLGERFRLH